MKLSVIIQAGGESRRMGCNKALVPFMGQPMIQRVIARVAPVADELLITSNQPEDLAFLQFPAYTDLVPGRGALVGLYTALSIAHFPLVAVVACDMAFANFAILAAERDMLLAQDADAVVPQTNCGYEPFHAIYRREECLQAVKTALDAGYKRANSWYKNVKMVPFTAQQIARYDPQGEAFININTPEELAYATKMVLDQSMEKVPQAA